MNGIIRQQKGDAYHGATQGPLQDKWNTRIARGDRLLLLTTRGGGWGLGWQIMKLGARRTVQGRDNGQATHTRCLLPGEHTENLINQMHGMPEGLPFNRGMTIQQNFSTELHTELFKAATTPPPPPCTSTAAVPEVRPKTAVQRPPRA